MILCCGHGIRRRNVGMWDRGACLLRIRVAVSIGSDYDPRVRRHALHCSYGGRSQYEGSNQHGEGPGIQSQSIKRTTPAGRCVAADHVDGSRSGNHVRNGQDAVSWGILHTSRGRTGAARGAGGRCNYQIAIANDISVGARKSGFGEFKNVAANVLGTPVLD